VENWSCHVGGWGDAGCEIESVLGKGRGGGWERGVEGVCSGGGGSVVRMDVMGGRHSVVVS
jgi:hypothetical protein